MKRYNVYVTAKKGIFDPAGAQAENALRNLGYAGFSKVGIGKFIQLECADGTTKDDVANACDKLLTNPVIEDYRIEEVSA